MSVDIAPMDLEKIVSWVAHWRVLKQGAEEEIGNASAWEAWWESKEKLWMVVPKGKVGNVDIYVLGSKKKHSKVADYLVQVHNAPLLQYVEGLANEVERLRWEVAQQQGEIGQHEETIPELKHDITKLKKVKKRTAK